MQAIPSLSRQEVARRMAAFVVECALGLLSSAERQFVHAAVQHGGILLQVEVERVIGEFITQEVLHLSRVFHLLLVIIQFAQHDIASAFSSKNLALDLLILDIENLHLLPPIYFSSVPSSLRQAKPTRSTRAASLRVNYLG